MVHKTILMGHHLIKTALEPSCLWVKHVISMANMFSVGRQDMIYIGLYGSGYEAAPQRLVANRGTTGGPPGSVQRTETGGGGGGAIPPVTSF